MLSQRPVWCTGVKRLLSFSFIPPLPASVLCMEAISFCPVKLSTSISICSVEVCSSWWISSYESSWSDSSFWLCLFQVLIDLAASIIIRIYHLDAFFLSLLLWPETWFVNICYKTKEVLTNILFLKTQRKKNMDPFLLKEEIWPLNIITKKCTISKFILKTKLI